MTDRMAETMPGTMPGPIRIIVTDDHPVVREGLVAILSTQPDFTIVGDAASGPATLELARELHPDIVLLDLAMPEMDGVETLRQLQQIVPETRVIIFTAFDTDERILSAVRAGAQGYLLKGAPRNDIFQAIRVVFRGGSLLEPMIAQKLLRQVSHESATDVALTPRELDVLRLLARGLQNKEIAIELGITGRTTKFHVGSLLRKLGAGNRTEAVAIAAQRGLIRLRPAE
ncbi:MAG TPA: response regulator transcription factor [Ktedonobacterales bacterium]|nr:response regulator transcription factor [Ktedonobacterales bacterium]